jgi:hypothetical protein
MNALARRTAPLGTGERLLGRLLSRMLPLVLRRFRAR